MLRQRRDLDVSITERLTGRSVVAFLSANHLDPDIAVESMVLAPSDERGDGGNATSS
jgi:hypothetical protein